MKKIQIKPITNPILSVWQHESWDQTEANVKELLSLEHAPGFHANGDDDSVNVPCGPESSLTSEKVLLNDAFIAFNHDTKEFSVISQADEAALYAEVA